MGYSGSRFAVTEMLAYLKVLEHGDTVKFSTTEPTKLAYSLRQAFYAAQLHPEFEPFVELRHSYVIEAHGDYVIARHLGEPKKAGKSYLAEMHAEVIAEHPEAYLDRVGKAVDEVLSATSLPRVRSLDEVLGAMTKYGKSVEEVYFPDVRFKTEDMVRLHRWTEANEWKLIDNEEEGITVTQREVPPEIIWRPPNAKK